jgi:hypothetical protein
MLLFPTSYFQLLISANSLHMFLVFSCSTFCLLQLLSYKGMNGNHDPRVPPGGRTHRQERDVCAARAHRFLVSALRGRGRL